MDKITDFFINYVWSWFLKITADWQTIVSKIFKFISENFTDIAKIIGNYFIYFLELFISFLKWMMSLL